MAFAPGLTAHHRIQEERVSARYVLLRAFRNGRAQCVVDRLHEPAFWRRAAAIPWMLALEAVRSVLRGGGPVRRVRVRRLAGYLWQTALLLAGRFPAAADSRVSR
jgi:hypothetical protein